MKAENEKKRYKIEMEEYKKKFGKSNSSDEPQEKKLKQF